MTTNVAGQTNLNGLLGSCKVIIDNINTCGLGQNCSELDITTDSRVGLQFTDLLTPYPGKTGTNKTYKGLLQTFSGESEDLKNGMTFAMINNPSARDEWLKNRYKVLKDAKQIPDKPSLNSAYEKNNSQDYFKGPHSSQTFLGEYNAEIRDFIQAVSDEYCYYQKRYILALNIFLNNYSDASIQLQQSANLNTARDTALKLNRRVNTIISFINYIANERLADLESLSTEINQSNNNIKESSTKLFEYEKMLTRYNKENEINKEMVEYTAEKNRAHQNLLGVYFTLNVVAIVSLFVIARSL